VARTEHSMTFRLSCRQSNSVLSGSQELPSPGAWSEVNEAPAGDVDLKERRCYIALR
jgi:hypothetical protein